MGFLGFLSHHLATRPVPDAKLLLGKGSLQHKQRFKSCDKRPLLVMSTWVGSKEARPPACGGLPPLLEQPSERVLSVELSSSDIAWLPYGIEIEFSHLSMEQTTTVLQAALQGRRDWFAFVMGHHRIIDRFGQCWHIKPDGQYLTEINTPVWHHESQLQQLKPVLSALSKAGAKLPEDAGLHIHLSGTYLRPAHLAHLLLFSYQYHEVLMEALHVPLARRHFCPNWHPSVLAQLLYMQPVHRMGLLHILQDEHSIRFGFNVNNLNDIGGAKETVELRYFNSTLDSQVVATYVWFAQALAWSAMQKEGYPSLSKLAERPRFAQLIQHFFKGVATSAIDEPLRVKAHPIQVKQSLAPRAKRLSERLAWYDVIDFP